MLSSRYIFKNNTKHSSFILKNVNTFLKYFHFLLLFKKSKKKFKKNKNPKEILKNQNTKIKKEIRN